MTEIVVDGSISIANGPKVRFSTKVAVEAYDSVSSVVVPAANELEVEAPPGTADTVQFLLISSDTYGEQLSYKVDDAGDSFALDGPHLLVGKGAVGLFYAQSPQKVLLNNETDKDVTIQILVGRDATP
jgi:hypothetical protein